jgi:hypothetical protein
MLPLGYAVTVVLASFAVWIPGTAELAAPAVAGLDKAEFIIHNQARTISEQNSYGHDPRSSKGRARGVRLSGLAPAAEDEAAEGEAEAEGADGERADGSALAPD